MDTTTAPGASGLLARTAEYGRQMHLQAPCHPARPDLCIYCREAAHPADGSMSPRT